MRCHCGASGDVPEERRAKLLPEDELLASLATVRLDDAHAERFRQGQRLALDAEPRGHRVRVYGNGTNCSARRPSTNGVSSSRND